MDGSLHRGGGCAPDRAVGVRLEELAPAPLLAQERAAVGAPEEDLHRWNAQG
jgi:hypothetical protein